MFSILLACCAILRTAVLNLNLGLREIGPVSSVCAVYHRTATSAVHTIKRVRQRPRRQKNRRQFIVTGIRLLPNTTVRDPCRPREAIVEAGGGGKVVAVRLNGDAPPPTREAGGHRETGGRWCGT